MYRQPTKIPPPAIAFDGCNPPAESPRAVKKRAEFEQSEQMLQMQIVKYVRTQHGKVPFNGSLSGLYQTASVHSRNIAKQIGNTKGWPDLQLAAPSANGEYCSLFLELKKPGLRLYKKDGTPHDEHFAEQLACHERLRAMGNAVHVVQDFDEAKRIIDEHLTPR